MAPALENVLWCVTQYSWSIDISIMWFKVAIVDSISKALWTGIPTRTEGLYRRAYIIRGPVVLCILLCSLRQLVTKSHSHVRSRSPRVGFPKSETRGNMTCRIISPWAWLVALVRSWIASWPPAYGMEPKYIRVSRDSAVADTVIGLKHALTRTILPPWPNTDRWTLANSIVFGIPCPSLPFLVRSTRRDYGSSEECCLWDPLQNQDRLVVLISFVD